MLAHIIRHEAKTAFPLLGALAAPVATATDTAGAWEALELRLSAGARSPLHTVPGDKVFYAALGSVTLTVGDEQQVLATGGFAHVPAGTPHCYENTSGAPARLVVIATGGGHVEFLRGMSALTREGRPDPDALAAHTARHGVRMLVPA